MKKKDLLKLLEEYPDDQEIAFYDNEYGEYIESFKIKEIATLGRFGWNDGRDESFYAPYKMWQSWEYLGYDTQVLVLEGD